MYEIHINASKIYLVKSAFISRLNTDETKLVAKYSGNKKNLLNYIDKAEKSPSGTEIYLHDDRLSTLKSDFFSLYSVIKASGGIVTNSVGELLLIYRKKNWDLPKGKRETNEKSKQTALREVKEEVGIIDLELLYDLPTTYHTYKQNNQRILKISNWYFMESDDNQLLPQTAEDIEKAVWVTIKDIKSGFYSPMYPNIVSLLARFFALQKL